MRRWEEREDGKREKMRRGRRWEGKRRKDVRGEDGKAGREEEKMRRREE